MKILHLVPDDKFVDMAIREFEAVAPNVHGWVSLAGTPPWHYIKDGRVQGLSVSQIGQLLSDPDLSGLVCHTLSGAHLEALDLVPPHVNVVWLGWGYDYYGLIHDAFTDGLVLPSTRALLRRMACTPATTSGASGHQPAELSLGRPYARPTAEDLARFARVDWFSPVVDSEFRLVRNQVPGFTARYLRWNYGTAELDYSVDGLGGQVPGPNVLVGNSATATNNHLEAFDAIERLGELKGRQLIVPLSYGDTAYQQNIARLGRARFGETFVPLTHFMPKQDYLRLLGSCGHVVMNHVRQQALGNLFISGLAGARLHLNRSSPLHYWLTSLGVSVGDSQQLDLTDPSPAERSAQRAVLVREFGTAVQRRRTGQLVDKALSPRK